MGYDHKYTDADVKSDPFLLAAAVQYARSYTGDFDFMVASADIVHLRGTLPVAIARGVLNCMRADPRVADDLPAPHNGHSDMMGKFEFKPMQLRLPAPVLRTKPRTRLVSVRSTLKHTYTWSRYTSEDADVTNKFHYVSARSGVNFYMPMMDFELRIISLCGVVNSTTFRTGNTVPEGRELCGSCDRQIKLPKGYLAGPGPQNITLAQETKPVSPVVTTPFMLGGM